MTDVTDTAGEVRGARGDFASIRTGAALDARRLLGGLALALAVHAGAEGLPGVAGYLLGQSVWVLLGVLLSLAAWRAWHVTVAKERRIWALLCLATAFMATGQLLFMGHVLARGVRDVSPVRALAGAFVLLAIVVFAILVAGLLRFRHASRGSRVRYVIDLIAGCVVLIGALEARVVGPYMSRNAVTQSHTQALYSTYVVLALLTLLVVAWLGSSMRADRWDPWVKLIAAGAVFFAIGLLLAPIVYVERQSLTESWLVKVADMSQITGLYCILVATVHRTLDTHADWAIRPLAIIEPSYGLMASVVLPAVELAAIPAFGASALDTADPVARLFRIIVTGAISVLFVVRTVFAAVDNDELMVRAVTDPLTGLFNHRHFHECLAREIAVEERRGGCVSVMVLDVDDFGAINNTAGHAAGDAALVEVARAVQRAVRTEDIVCRIGGDEIGVILPGADGAAALSVAWRVLDEVRSIPDQSRGVILSASAGVAAFPRHAASREDLVRKADGALYWTKFHGKDRALLYDPAVVVTLDPEDVLRQTRERADMEAVRALAAAVDARDPATQNRSRRVAALGTRLAHELALEPDQTVLIEYACLLHDVGNIATPDRLLRSPSGLSPAEIEQLGQHVILGEEILSSMMLQEMLPCIRHHHERWDGTGYPDGLAGEEIPLGARIIALCGAYADLVSGAPGAKALSRASALQEIDLRLGTEFDPTLGERFITMLASGGA